MTGAEHIGRGVEQTPGAGKMQPVIGQGIQPERIQPVIGSVTGNPQAAIERHAPYVRIQRRVEAQPRISAETRTELSAETQMFIKGQAGFLREGLKIIGLEDIPVQDEAEVRDASDFAGRMTVGYTWGDIPSTILASSEAVSHPVSVLLVAPTEDRSGLYIDDETQTVWTDSFWVIEDGVIKHIRSTSPVPLDHCNLEFDAPRPDMEIATREQKILHTFDELTTDKHRVKQVLADAGLSVPAGRLIPGGPSETVRAEVHAALEDYPDEVVLKTNTGSMGNNIVIGHPQDRVFKIYAGKLIDGVNDHAQSFVIEPRIQAVPQPVLANLLDQYLDEVDPETAGEQTDPDAVDYNFRVLTTLGHDPKIVDDEIRYHIKSEYPINISQGARAVRTDVLENPELMERIHATATKATKILYAQVAGEGEEVCGMVGVDIMVDREGNLPILEVNGLRSGGLATLASLDKKPLASVSEVLLPSYVPVLQKHFANRPATTPQLRPVALNTRDRIMQAMSYDILGDLPKASSMIQELLAQTPDDIDTDWADRYLTTVRAIIARQQLGQTQAA